MRAAPTERAAAALAAACFGLAAPLAYVGQRLFERARGGVADPTLILWEAHTAFYWRAGTAAWWAGVIAIGVYALARRRAPTERVTRALAVALVPIAIALVVVTWWYP
ncbi:MAG: hypothetical protein KF729_09105 [Sandaracinaceae bacterium]|nr:hypothetical protein [Sandaracinaceae bacterium]